MKSLAAALLLLFLFGTGVGSAQTPPSATPHGAFVDVDGSRLYYEECGTGPDAVILLHDGVVDSAVWGEVWPAFCKRFRTVRYAAWLIFRSFRRAIKSSAS
jgi:3-oxoadipate enol-lactonase